MKKGQQMNIKQAKQIPIEIVAVHLGGKEAQTKGHEIWFYSPFRPDENTPSFKVNQRLNTWYDFALGQGGTILDLWLDFHQLSRDSKDGIKSALQGLEPFFKGNPTANSNQATPAPKKREIAAQEQPRFKLAKKLSSKIWFNPLLAEIERRGLSLELVSKYVKQAHIDDTKTGKQYTGLAFANDQNGFEVSIPNPSRGESFKTNVGDKGYTSYIEPDNEIALVFEGFWDFLTFLQSGGDISKSNVFILNSTSFTGYVIEAIKSLKGQIHSVFLFLDNDATGMKAMQRFADELEPEGFTIGTLNHIYEGYKDLNDYWINAPHVRIKKSEQPKIFDDTAWNNVKQVLKTNPK